VETDEDGAAAIATAQRKDAAMEAGIVRVATAEASRRVSLPTLGDLSEPASSVRGTCMATTDCPLCAALRLRPVELLTAPPLTRFLEWGLERSDSPGVEKTSLNLSRPVKRR